MGVVSAKLGRFNLASAPRWAKPDSDRDIRIWFDPFITTINIYHHLSHSSHTSIVSDIVSGTGYSLFRTDTVYSERVLFFPDGCRPSEGVSQAYIAMQFSHNR